MSLNRSELISQLKEVVADSGVKLEGEEKTEEKQTVHIPEGAKVEQIKDESEPVMPPPELTEVVPKNAPPPTQYDQQVGALQAQMTQAQQVLAQINAAYNGPALRQLEQEDPGKAALTRQKLSEQAIGAQQRLAQLDGVRGQMVAQADAAEMEKCRRAVPEWKNEKTRVREWTAMADWLKEKGYTDQEILTVNKASQMARIRDLWKRETYKPIRVRGGSSTPNRNTVTGRFEKPSRTGTLSKQGKLAAMKKVIAEVSAR